MLDYGSIDPKLNYIKPKIINILDKQGINDITHFELLDYKRCLSKVYARIKINHLTLEIWDSEVTLI